MNSIITTATGNSTLTMSSREIAELTGKMHRNVVRDIEKMLKNIGEGVLKFEHTYTNDQNGQEYREFLLPKNLTLNLVLGYRDDLRLKVVDRWLELEAQNVPAAPQNMVEALTLALEQQKIIAAKEAELAEAAPQIDAYKKLASLDGVHNLRSAAQQCGWPERKFIQQLCQMRWIYTHNVTGRKCAYADKVKAGLMEAKNVEVKRTGYVEGVGQPMITQAGLAELRSILGPYEAHTRAEAMKTEIAKRSKSRKVAHKPFTKTPA